MKEKQQVCPHCNGCGVIKMSYHHQISVLQFPPTLKSIKTVVHMQKLNQPKPVHPDPPPGVKVRVESNQVEGEENQVYVKHNIWVEEAPPELSTLDVHLDIQEVIPVILRGQEAREISQETLQKNSQIIDIPILEAPRLQIKDNCDAFSMFNVKSQMVSRGTQTEDIYFNLDSAIMTIQTGPQMTKVQRFGIIKQLVALVKILDWVDAVSRIKKLQY